jgi:hypothetical protein
MGRKRHHYSFLTFFISASVYLKAIKIRVTIENVYPVCPAG